MTIMLLVSHCTRSHKEPAASPNQKLKEGEFRNFMMKVVVGGKKWWHGKNDSKNINAISHKHTQHVYMYVFTTKYDWSVELHKTRRKTNEEKSHSG